MKNNFLIFLIFLSHNIYSQEDAWVYFTDKPNAQFYLDNPLEMLSQRAIDRRVAQSIFLDITDAPIYQPYLDELANQSGIEIKAKSKWFNCVHVRGSVESINSLLTLSFVQSVFFADKSLNSSSRLSFSKKKFKPVNKQMDVQVDFNYGTSANQIQMLNGNLLHQQGYTGSGKIIAVMDAGFPQVDVISPFQRIRDNNQILGGYNFVDRNEDFYTRNSHGTMVLSTMAGYVDNQLVGTAPDAQYYLFITEDTNSENPVEESYWVEAAEVADSLGVDVINTSLGYFEYDNPNYSYTYEDLNGTTAFMSRGVDMAFSKGMICVTSAGNSGGSSNPYVAVPAEANHNLAVGAVKGDETYASFSSVGPTFDNRIKPDVMAKGQNATVSSTTGVITTANGTSFAGPIMAGMVASFWQSVPQLTNQQVVDFVKQSADRFSNPDEFYGYGIPDFNLALQNALLSLPDNQKQYFFVYPNPFSENLNVINSNNLEEINFSIFNSLGQLVRNYTLSKSINVINANDLERGCYFYKIEGNGISHTGKLIKK
jgi:subtilisin family serine protease